MPKMSQEGLFSIAGKTAVVTGGSRGIGRMIAQGFVEAGASVYITSRSAEACDKAAAELSELPGGGKCTSLPADLASEEGCSQLAAAVKEREESLDILVNNAGVMGELWMPRHTQAVWQDVLALNVEAVFYMVRELLPLLKAASRDEDPARVVNIGSIGGLRAPEYDIYAYSSSKAAVHHLTAHLAKRLGPGVTVNALAPGPCETKMTETMLKLFGASIVEDVPLKRICQPDDVVGAAIFLASRAGAYLTGAVIPIDGGSTL